MVAFRRTPRKPNYTVHRQKTGVCP